MTFVFLPVLCQDVLCQDLGEHGSFRLRQRLAIGLRLRLSQEGLHLLLGQFVVVAHLLLAVPTHRHPRQHTKHR